MNIIYLHGFNSDGNGSTATKLKEVYGKLLLTPSYDYANPDKAYKTINKFLIENATINTVLVGTSLGGFWANKFAQKFGLPVVLVNPALNPAETTKQFIGENKNFSTGKVVYYTKENAEVYKKYMDKINPETKRTTILSINDKIINYKFAEKILKESKIVYEKKEGHQFNNIDKIVFAIDEQLTEYVNNLSAKILNEHVINLLPKDITAKEHYADEVYSMLQKAYSKIGGLAGNGFSSVDDMIHNIDMWKLVKKDGKIIACVMYRNKAGRKGVAGATDGSADGKRAFAQLQNDDFSSGRSYIELSGPFLAFNNSRIPSFEKYVIPFEKVSKLLGKTIEKPSPDDEEVLKYPNFKDAFYRRMIGGEWHTKLLVGKSGNTFY